MQEEGSTSSIRRLINTGLKEEIRFLANFSGFTEAIRRSSHIRSQDSLFHYSTFPFLENSSLVFSNNYIVFLFFLFPVELSLRRLVTTLFFQFLNGESGTDSTPMADLPNVLKSAYKYRAVKF